MSELTVTQIKKYNKKSVPQLLKLAEHAFNAFIRHRDSENGYFRCISCGNYKPINQMHASHYMAAGNYTATRFHESNVHGACIKCNKFLHGNLIEYRRRLCEKIGGAEVDKIELLARAKHKYEKTALINIICTYKSKHNGHKQQA